MVQGGGSRWGRKRLLLNRGFVGDMYVVVLVVVSIEVVPPLLVYLACVRVAVLVFCSLLGDGAESGG